MYVYIYTHTSKKPFVRNCLIIWNVFSFDEMKNTFILFFLFRPFSYKLQFYVCHFFAKI